MPMDAMKGISLARSASRPRMVVSTAIALRASPSGFSANSMMRPVSSIFMRPNAAARSSSMGTAETVMSAPTSRCFLMKGP